MKRTCAAFLVVPLVAVGCGGDSPTTPTPRAYAAESTSESGIAAHSASCVGFRQEANGEASASANLSVPADVPVPIEMGAGTCTGARSVVARGDRGAVTAILPVGDSFVRFENIGDSAVRYRLTLRYLILY